MKHVILVILLTIGVWAQEIGVPYVDTTRDEVVQSAALSPDRETFYTYANNTLTHWSLNPVKVLENIEVRAGKLSKIYISPDNKKIIFAVQERSISLYDLVQHKFIQTVYFPIQSGSISQESFSAVDRDRNVAIYDLDTLKIITQTEIVKFKINCDECTDSAYALISSNDLSRLILITGSRLLVLDKTTLKVLQEYEGISEFDNYFISLDRSKLVGFNKYFDLHSFQMISLTEKEKTLLKPCNYIRHPSSILKTMALIHCAKSYSFFNNQTTKKLATLHNIRGIDWIIITPNGYFDGSPESRKYLYIKTPSGESVPIDDATFNKFHKKINLKN